MQTFKKHTKIEILWYDSAFQGGWVPPDKREPLPILPTIGYLVEQTPERIEIAMSVSENGLYLNPLAIPIGCVKEIFELEQKNALG